MNQLVKSSSIFCQSLVKERAYEVSNLPALYKCYGTYVLSYPLIKFLPVMGSIKSDTSSDGWESGYIKGLEFVLSWLKD